MKEKVIEFIIVSAKNVKMLNKELNIAFGHGFLPTGSLTSHGPDLVLLMSREARLTEQEASFAEIEK